MMSYFKKSRKIHGGSDVQCKVGGQYLRNTEESIDMLGLKEAADELARMNSVRWFGMIMY